MIDIQNMKFAIGVAPISVSAATATDTEVDTKGYDYICAVGLIGLIGTGTITVWKYQESDASASGEADITGGAFTGNGAAAGAGFDDVVGNEGKIILAFFNLTKRKRYISAVITTATNASLVALVYILSRAEQMPDTATKRGALQQLLV